MELLNKRKDYLYMKKQIQFFFIYTNIKIYQRYIA